MSIYYVACAPLRPGATMPDGSGDECPHRHRTPAGAEACIDKLDRAIKRGHGKDAYCDRLVMEVRDGVYRVWHLWEDDDDAGNGET